MIPALDGGRLPPGVWDCTLAEIETAFGATARRQVLLARLRRFLADCANLPRCPILIDGSFVIDKPDPGDIDICADLHALPASDRHTWESLFFAKKWYLEKDGIDFWIRSPDFPEDVTKTEFPRIRPADIKRLDLPAGAQKGYLRLP